MRILRNKFFIIGNLVLILIAIPLTLFFISQQTKTRSKAAPSTSLYFSPANPTTAPGQNVDVDIMVNPGTNEVQVVDMDIRYDPTKLEYVSINPNLTAFPQTFKGPIIQNGSIVISLNIGGTDPSKRVTTITKVATVTFKALPGSLGTTDLSFFRSTDPLLPTRVFSAADVDGSGENVLNTVSPATITINSSLSPTPSGGTLSPTPTGTGVIVPTPTTGTTTTNPSPTTAGGGTGGTTTTNPSPTTSVGQPSPTSTQSGTSSTSTNQIPVCTSINTDQNPSGNAPFSLTFTGNGRDSDGTINKAIFDFGDGPVQEITQGGGLNTATVSIQVAHTYRNAGSYQASVTFTDNNGKLSTTTAACTKTITVSQSVASSGGTSSGGTTGTSGTSSGGSTGGAIAAQPTLAPTGTTTTTIGIIGGVILTLVGGVLLLML